jgi:hypothetical protein
MTESDDFPAQFPPDPRCGAQGLRWTIGVLAPTAIALAVLNSQTIVDWVEDLPATSTTARAVAAADAWHSSVAQFGLDAPRDSLHRAWIRAEAMRWPDGWLAGGHARSGFGLEQSKIDHPEQPRVMDK